MATQSDRAGGGEVGIKIVVSGGRNYHDRFVVNRVLSDIHRTTPIHTLIHGGARGADALCAEWAAQHPEIVIVGVPAKWEQHGRGAGPIRNEQMIVACEPDLAVIFPGEKGTADMLRRCRNHGIKIILAE